MRRLLILLALFSFCVLSSEQSLAECTLEKGVKAERQTDYLKSWTAVYDFFKEYAECDDGGIAEGVSDAVVKLFIKDWPNIASLQKMTDTDQDFKNFVFRHIDQTADFREVKQIGNLAHQECPQNAQRICKDLQMQIDGNE